MVTAVRARYQHIAGSWQRATPERRRGLIGELELLVLQLPAVSPDYPDRDDIVVLRAAIFELVTEISLGLAEPDCQSDPSATPTRPDWPDWGFG